MADGAQNPKQSALDAGRAALLELERIMDENPAPFEGAGCNRRYAKMRRRLARWHDDMAECVDDGDPSLNFGGGK